MKLLRILFVFGLVVMGFDSWSQGNTSIPDEAPNSLHPATPKSKKYYAPQRAKATSYKRPKVTHSAQYEFYKRVERAAKDKQRLLKKFSKPQYSNPAYFGHKRKPKKRPPSKMRYCDVCGIRH